MGDSFHQTTHEQHEQFWPVSHQNEFQFLFLRGRPRGRFAGNGSSSESDVCGSEVGVIVMVGLSFEPGGDVFVDEAELVIGSSV